MPSGKAHMNCHASAFRAASLISACVAFKRPYRILSLIVPIKVIAINKVIIIIIIRFKFSIKIQ